MNCRAASIAAATLALLCACRPAADQPAKAVAPAPAPVAAAPAAATPAVIDETTPTQAGAQAFLDAVYKAESDPAPNTFGAKSSKVYDAAFLRLMSLDDCLSNGDIGTLDYDPLCNCQDPAAVKATPVITRADGTTASANVQLKSAVKEALTMDLVFEAGHWRVHDITNDGDSVVKTLQVATARPNKLLAACKAKL